MGKLILPALARIACIALLGAVAMAVLGAIMGALSGIAYALALDPNLRVYGAFEVGATMGAYCAAITGAGTGLIAFAIVGAFSLRTQEPFALFKVALRGGWRGAAVGLVAGGVVMGINVTVWSHFFGPPGGLQQGVIVQVWSPTGIGCFCGIIGGFAVGGIIGSVLGARRAIRRPPHSGALAAQTIGLR